TSRPQLARSDHSTEAALGKLVPRCSGIFQSIDHERPCEWLVRSVCRLQVESWRCLMLVLNVVGARPNFMKIAPVVEAMREAGLPQYLVHTGQHYDEKMSRLFFEELGIPAPDLNLEVGSGSQAVQTAEILRRFEPVVLETRPDMVVVVGDVNSTMACTLVSVKLGIPVAHIEAGLRSFDRSMPEEINRLVTDTLSDLLFVSEPSGLDNLRAEGVPDSKVHFVGNVMIDTLLRHRQSAEKSDIRKRLG